MKTIIVGDSPSKTNTFKDIAFIGAKCWTRLEKWLNYLELDNIHGLINSNTDSDIFYIKNNYKGAKVIAIGKVASNRLNKLNIEHYVLPHPSGLNRQNNNKRYINKKLKECKIWLNSR